MEIRTCEEFVLSELQLCRTENAAMKEAIEQLVEEKQHYEDAVRRLLGMIELDSYCKLENTDKSLGIYTLNIWETQDANDYKFITDLIKEVQE